LGDNCWNSSSKDLVEGKEIDKKYYQQKFACHNIYYLLPIFKRLKINLDEKNERDFLNKIEMIF